jgi:hypothetical protein
LLGLGSGLTTSELVLGTLAAVPVGGWIALGAIVIAGAGYYVYTQSQQGGIEAPSQGDNTPQSLPAASPASPMIDPPPGADGAMSLPGASITEPVSLPGATGPAMSLPGMRGPDSESSTPTGRSHEEGEPRLIPQEVGEWPQGISTEHDSGDGDAPQRQQIRSISDEEIDKLIDAIEDQATTDPVKPSELSRPPSLRLDLANAPLTAEQQARLEQRLAQLKAEGKLSAEFIYVPPSAAGFAISANDASRAGAVIGLTLDEVPEIAECWNKAVDRATHGQALTRENYEDFYKATQKAFWQIVADNADTRQYFEDMGFVVEKGRAPYLDIQGMALQETALGLDHTKPKAGGDNYRFALDPKTIQILFQADNTKLSHIEKKHVDLQRGSDRSGKTAGSPAAATATKSGAKRGNKPKKSPAK